MHFMSSLFMFFVYILCEINVFWCLVLTMILVLNLFAIFVKFFFSLTGLFLVCVICVSAAVNSITQ